MRGAAQDVSNSQTIAPLFSIIILNWNGRHLLEECLPSIDSQTFRDFETIVVDNGSTDGSVDWAKARWEESVSTIALPSNRGFAGGNNAGIRVARGRYLILLNNDTAVDPGWLAALAEAVRRHPDAGMFSPKILNYYRRDEIDNTGLVIYPDGLARGRHRLERDESRFDAEDEALCPSGCAGVYARIMLDEVGLLDESFFSYAEDVDLGLRGCWAGWKCNYVPDAVVYHKYSASTGEYSALKVFLVERNRAWVLLKNFPLREILISPIWTVLRYGVHFLGILSGRGASGKFSRDHSVFLLLLSVFKAEVAAIAGARPVLRGRRRSKRFRRISTGEFRVLLARFRMGVWEAAMRA